MQKIVLQICRGQSAIIQVGQLPQTTSRNSSRCSVASDRCVQNPGHFCRSVVPACRNKANERIAREVLSWF